MQNVNFVRSAVEASAMLDREASRGGDREMDGLCSAARRVAAPTGGGGGGVGALAGHSNFKARRIASHPYKTKSGHLLFHPQIERHVTAPPMSLFTLWQSTRYPLSSVRIFKRTCLLTGRLNRVNASWATESFHETHSWEKGSHSLTKHSQHGNLPISSKNNNNNVFI